MLNFPTTISSALLLFLFSFQVQAQLSLNEFLASNNENIADESGDFEDWIEIYNAGSADINLAGYYISDDLLNPLLWQISTDDPSLTTVPAGGFLILWADKDIDDGANHLDFKLGASGEDIVLVDPDGVTIIDQYSFTAQVEDVSFGRVGNAWDFFAQPTPGAANNTPPGAPTVFQPIASLQGGLHSGTISVTLSSATNGATIYYTTDGSHPSDNDDEYDGPIEIDGNTPLRARAYLDPSIPSSIMTETYLFDIDHTFPVIAYTADPEEMFGSNPGMYVNFEEDIEINVNVEMYELDGTQAFNQVLESEINGGGSAAQKSLALKAKSSLGSATIDHQIFPLSNKDKYRSLILRNSGQDWNKSFFRDAVGTSLAWDVSDVNTSKETIVEPKIHGQAYRPCVTYINGAYWGVYNIRERTDKRYVKVHFGLDDNEIDFIENHSEAKEGDLEAFEELALFLEDNDLDSESGFQYVADRVDLDDYMDFIAFNIYLDNNDWPGNNHRQFRERVSDGKWRYLIYDLDFSFGLFVPGQPWNSGYNDANALERLLTENSSWPNPSNATLLFRRLMENDNWRTPFINRMADQLNLLYNDDRVLGRIGDFQTEYAPEVQEHFDLWQDGFNNWNENVDVLRNFAEGRADNVRDHFISEIDEIDGIAELVINLNNQSDGEVQLSTITVHANNAPFVGTYFQGVDIPVIAFPNRGKVLQSWSGSLAGDDPNESININGNSSITANFGPGSAAEDAIVINEINYNSIDDASSDDWVELYNPNAFAVDISGWYLEDESDEFFGLPANTILPAGGYLVLAERSSKFAEFYPQVSNYIGDFSVAGKGFGLSNKGELITLKNAEGVLIDEVEYDDKTPWPVEADGGGPTLQLIDPALDNTVASNWEAIPATPGALNGTNTNQQSQNINFPAIPDQLNTNQPFDISASASSGLPVGFTIVSGPATISGNTISLNGTVGEVVVSASQSGNASWLPAVNVEQSFEVTENAPPPPPPPGAYCDSESDAPWHEWIAGVELNDLSNSSPKDQYSDFTNLFANLEQGKNYGINLTAGFSYIAYDEYFNVWIDYDQNEVFDLENELVFSGIITDVANGTETASISGEFLVPQNAMIGATRMRVSMMRGAFPPACGNFAEGEVEDYSVNISSGNIITLALDSCPDDILQTADVGQESLEISWNEPTASSNCSPSTIEIIQTDGPANGSSFEVGSTTTIAYALSDECGNVVDCTFEITINAPDNGSIALECPSDITIMADEGLDVAVVTWDSPGAATTCPSNGLLVVQSSGESSGAFFTVGTHIITYNAQDACGNNESCLFTITVIPFDPGNEAPCESSSDFPWHEWISNVQLNTIDNSSGKTDYSDFTNINTTLIPSNSYDLKLMSNFSWQSFEEHWKVWIDYNQNGIFEEPSEIAFSEIQSPPPNGTGTSSTTGNIIIPSNALIGTTVMRISMKRGAEPDPCETFGYGEVEDYTIMIEPDLGEESRLILSDKTNIRLYPNPAFAELNINFGDTEISSFEIFNINAQRITIQQGVEGKKGYRLDVSHLPIGMYLTKFRLTNGQSIAKRFVIGK